MTANAPSPPFRLLCAWCEFYIVVNARGAHRGDQGAGVEAADLMREHVEDAHGRTWDEYLAQHVRSSQ